MSRKKPAGEQAPAHVSPKGKGRAARAKPTNEPLPCTTAALLEEKAVSYLWHGRIVENAVTLLAGASEQGKSTVATAIAAAVSTGGSLPGGPQLGRRNVLWYGAEEFASETIRPRLRAAGADLNRVYLPEYECTGKRISRPQLPKDAALVQALAKKLSAGLIVFDPVGSYIEHDLMPDANTTARDVCQALFEVAQNVRCVVLIIKHPRKIGTQAPGIEQVSGGREWTNTPRCVLLAGPHPEVEGTSCLVAGKNSTGAKGLAICYRIVSAEGSPVIEWLAEEKVTAEQLFELGNAAHERDALNDAKMLLIDRLTGGEQRAKDLLKWAEESGVSSGTLRRAKKLLGISSHPVGPVETRFHVWRAPPEGFPKTEEA